MAFHCVTSWPDWIFFHQQSWVVVVFLRNAGSCPQTEFLNWFGTVEVKIQRPQVIAHWGRGRFPGWAPEVSHLQPDQPTSSGQASSSSISTSAFDGFQSGSRRQWTQPSGPETGVVRTFTEGPRGKRNSEAPHINDSSSPLNVVLLYFTEIVMLVVETNRYYHDHLGRLDEGPSPLPDVTEAEMLVFLAITIQTGRCIWNKLTDYWTRAYITIQCSMVTLWNGTDSFTSFAFYSSQTRIRWLLQRWWSKLGLKSKYSCYYEQILGNFG